MAATTWDDIERCLSARVHVRVDTPARRAAVAVVLRDGEAGIEVLFIRRAEHPRDPWSGQMAFPGGRAEPGDADLEATAVRETLEETGLDLVRDAVRLGALDEIRAMARLQPLDLVIAPFVFRLLRPVALAPSPEVRSLHWLPLEDLMGPGFRSTMDYAHGETTLQFPCLRLETLVIWGLTYRMFTSLQDVLGRALP